MKTIKINVSDNIYSHIMFFLKSLKSDELEIVEYDKDNEPLSIEDSIEQSINSKILKKSHDEIFDELIKKYATN